jgi:hypothetical protein
MFKSNGDRLQWSSPGRGHRCQGVFLVHEDLTVCFRCFSVLCCITRRSLRQ